jgi:putative transposase
VKDPQLALRLRLRELAATRIVYGYRRLQVLLQREGWHVNHKRAYRLYRLEGLTMRKKTPRRRVAYVKREIHPAVLTRNECWSMDFVSDQLFDDRRLRVLVIVENYTRECLALHANARIRGIDVVTTLKRITKEQGFPKAHQSG